jgi:Uma2 family endonuclease
MSAVPTDLRRRYTFAEYLAYEESVEWRNEFHEGEILAMSGSSPEHSLISVNVARAIGDRLRGSCCRVYGCNLKVGIGCGAHVCYPDVSVFCGPVECDPNDPMRYVVTNPRVIVEVLSPMSGRYDRTAKFAQYAALDSLQEYVMVYEEEARVESFVRQSDGSWNYCYYTGLSATGRIRAVEIDIPLAEIYTDVTLPVPTLESNSI